MIMNLKPQEVYELNSLLSNVKLDLPSYRRSIDVSGSNIKWLKKNILKRNPEISERILLLLGIKK